MTAALILENDHRRRQEGRRRANIGVGGLREILESQLTNQGTAYCIWSVISSISNLSR